MRSSQPQAASNQLTPQQVNMLARQAVIKQGVDMWLPIAQGTSTAGPGAVINIPVRNVGLVKRFVIRLTALITNATGPTQTLTALGASNFLSNVTFTDLSNQTRINDAGWHLNVVSTAKRRRIFGAAFTSDTPTGWGNNFNPASNATGVMTAQTSIASAATSNLFMEFEVPLSYTDHDLRGAIYMNVVNATANLQFTLNPNMFAATGTDATLAVYQSSSAVAPTLTSWTYTVYQNFLDQLPISQNGGPVLPLLDLSTAYLLNNTSVASLVQNQDNPVPYANFRDFMSTTFVYDNNGTLNVGSDINYISIQSANYTNILKLDPFTQTLLTRLIVGDDPPKGMYYIDHRAKPVSTIQYGNMQLILNFSNVGSASAALLVGYESLAIINQITQAGSLYGN